MLEPIHVHTSTCWQETHAAGCYEYRIAQLENLVLTVQTVLRQVGAQLDRVETSATIALKHPARDV